MTRVLTILIGLTTLILGLNYGSFIEITTQPGHRIGTIILTILIGLTFWFLIRQSLTLKQLILKFGLTALTVIILLPYLWLGLWTVPQTFFSKNYPMWQDVSTLTKDNDEVLVGQWIEISGSLHAVQNRKILYDFNNGIRISYIYPDNKLNGTWTIHRFGFDNDTIFKANFENGRIKK